jgi:FixJ family two-component response regulator
MRYVLRQNVKEPGNPSLVFVVDDDSSFRRSTELLIRTAGLDTQGFGSAEFLRSHRPDVPSRLILDVRFPHV